MAIDFRGQAVLVDWLDFGRDCVIRKVSGTNVLEILSNNIVLTLPTSALTLATLTGTETLTNKTLTNPTVSTGTFTSPTLVTPALGTPSSGVISACTSTSMVLVSPLLGTPTSGVLSNCTGFPRPVTTVTTGTTVLTAAQSGGVWLCNTVGGICTFTLPSAAVAGLMYTFIQINAANTLAINASADSQGFIINTPSTELGGAAATWASVVEADGAPGIVNTAGNVGDQITIISDGTVTWYGIGFSAGIWAGTA